MCGNFRILMSHSSSFENLGDYTLSQCMRCIRTYVYITFLVVHSFSFAPHAITLYVTIFSNDLGCDAQSLLYWNNLNLTFWIKYLNTEGFCWDHVRVLVLALNNLKWNRLQTLVVQTYHVCSQLATKAFQVHTTLSKKKFSAFSARTFIVIYPIRILKCCYWQANSLYRIKM